VLFIYLNWPTDISIPRTTAYRLSWKNPYEKNVSVLNITYRNVDMPFVMYHYHVQMPFMYERNGEIERKKRGIYHLYWMGLSPLSIDNDDDDDTLNSRLYRQEVLLRALYHDTKSLSFQTRTNDGSIWSLSVCFFYPALC
jgi:hypothetical protein